jgi:hypothetical protein
MIKSYNIFINEGAVEKKKIDELLDIMSRRKLTAEENELLIHLSKGGALEEDKPTLVKHKTGGGYMFDEKGNVMTEEEDEKPGQEFTTSKGKQMGADKLKKENIIDARVYRNRDSDERFFYVATSYETDSGMTSDWIIYRTAGGEKYPLGMFLDTNAPKFRYYKTTPANILWKELDFKYDYGMILDDDLYEDFINFVELYKENQNRNKGILEQIHKRFCSLL